MRLQNARQLKIHMRSLHEGGEATSWSVPAAPYCQRLHKQQQLYGGNCYCIYVTARVATITCMVGVGCNCMEWGLVTCGGRGRMVNKRPWAATPRKGHPLLLHPAADPPFLSFPLHRIRAITNCKGKGVSGMMKLISNC